MNGTTFQAGTFGPTLPAGWALEGASDFNADGAPDYLLFAAATRGTAIWFLNGTTFVGGALGPALPAGYTLASP